MLTPLAAALAASLAKNRTGQVHQIPANAGHWRPANDESWPDEEHREAMSRRRRRAPERRPTGTGVQDTFTDAVQHHQAGRLVEAEQRYRQILAIDPGHADALHLLGVANFQMGHLDLAIDLIGKALAVKPDYPEALGNLGNALVNHARLDDAIANYRKALDLQPDYVEAHLNLGNALARQGKLGEAARRYRRVLDFRANDVEALINLGNVLGEIGEPDAAIDCYRKALVFRPDLAEAHNNLGVALYGVGRLDEAIASYRHALEVRPDFVMALNNLALALLTQGNPAAAFGVAKRSLHMEEAPDIKGLLVSCLSRAHGAIEDEALRPLMIRALSEPWEWPGSLAPASIDLIKLNRDIADCMARAAEAWPRPLPGHVLFGATGLAAVAGDPLLSALLDAAPVCDIELERFLTTARRALLDAADEMTGTTAGIAFYCALARQCFINEHVFAVTADESRKAGDLRSRLSAALADDAPVPVPWLIAVAAYFPLSTLQHCARLLERSWPEDVATLLTQQVSEPAEERRLGAIVPRLTEIENDVSLLVQRQYEENPYPRWIKIPPSQKASSIDSLLRQMFPLAAFERSSAGSRLDMLVAGCGTGQQSIRASQQFPEARILAVDLSRASLAHAMRKTHELGLSSIEYAQADLLKLGSLDRRFDVILASGVLHHLADPWAGWWTLLSLLRPGGFMFVGLYSKIARRDIARLRQSIAALGYGTSADEIRRCRQDLMNQANGLGRAAARASDLFTISGCRDLLFHVQEHHVTLTAIESFLQEHGVAFVGFDIAPDVLQSYRLRFPGDRAATNLAQWQVFENDNPETFVAMYQFWVQKR